MSKLFAFVVLALAGTALVLPDSVFAAGGRGGVGAFSGGFRGPAFIGPRPVFRGHMGIPRTVPRAVIPPAARGFGTITPARPFGTVAADRPFGTVRSATGAFGATAPLKPFGRLARRHHRFYHSGWAFPGTIGGDAGYYGYIGTPYDPSEAIPVYGPSRAESADEVSDQPQAPATAPAARVSSTAEENRDACRAEKVTVPSGEGEREITVVRC